MPIYEYRCEDCGHVFEVLQRGFEERQEKCPICTGDSQRVMSNTSFVLKGSGWYVTDYSGKNPSTGSDPGAKAPEAGNGDNSKPKTESPCAAKGCAKSCAADS